MYKLYANHAVYFLTQLALVGEVAINVLKYPE